MQARENLDMATKEKAKENIKKACETGKTSKEVCEILICNESLDIVFGD